MECTCRIEVHNVTLLKCPLCKAAADLYEAVLRIVLEDEAGEITGGAIEDCRNAIEKAEAES